MSTTTQALPESPAAASQGQPRGTGLPQLITAMLKSGGHISDLIFFAGARATSGKERPAGGTQVQGVGEPKATGHAVDRVRVDGKKRNADPQAGAGWLGGPFLW